MRRRLTIFFTLLCVVGAGLWSFAINHRTARADSISTLLSGSAYGLSLQTFDKAANLAGGPIGEVSTTCNPYPANTTRTTPGLNLFHGLITSSPIQDSLMFTRDLDRSSVLATSTIEKLTIGRSLLDPLLEVDGLHAVARSTARTEAASSQTGESFFGAMRIAGLHLPLILAPNTHLTVPGLGSIVLNEQIVQNLNSVTTYAEVNMLDITLGVGNILHQAAGTRILIGHTASIDSIVSVLAAMQAHASGLYTALGARGLGNVQLGPLPNTEIGCVGGTSSANSVDLRLPLLINTGAAETRTTGVMTSSTVAVRSTVTIAHLSLLGGLVRAGHLQEDAYATYDGTKGVAFGHFNVSQLTIGGLNIVPNVHIMANDRITLPGLGYVTLDEVVPSPLSFGFAVNALDLFITTPNNRLHLAAGLHIVVGHADAGITVFN
jgi:hypothetical protein